MNKEGLEPDTLLNSAPHQTQTCMVPWRMIKDMCHVTCQRAHALKTVPRYESTSRLHLGKLVLRVHGPAEAVTETVT